MITLFASLVVGPNNTHSGRQKEKKSVKSEVSASITETLYNQLSLQHGDSNQCGAYCIYYLYHRCHRHNMDDILSHFSKNRVWNDMIVNSFVDKMLIKSM